MKILYVTTINLTINSFLVPHIKMLIENGNTVDVAANLTHEISKELDLLNVKHNNICFERSPLNINNIKAFKKIKALVSRGKYDIVHVHTPVAAFITRVAIRNLDVKVIYTAHGFHFYKGAPFINWILYYPIECIAAKWTDTLITINKEDYKIANKRLFLRNGGKIYKINGVGIDFEKYNLENFNSSNYRRDLGLDDSDFVILILAELNKNKNQLQAIKALEEIKCQYKNIKLLLAGAGPLEKDLKRYVEIKGLSENVKFLGWRNDSTELIYISDIVGLFSKREGLPKCLMEAMICRKILITTNNRGSKELIINKKNGYIVDVGDSKETIKCILTLYNLNMSQMERMGNESYKIVEKFNIKAILSELKKIYI